jgi:4-amino-4-deoxychorismate lyase
MYQLVESVRIENRQLHHIDLHNQRLNRAMQCLFGIDKKTNLEEIIDIPPGLTNNRYKCRVNVSPESINVNIAPYIQREIKTLKIVYDNDIDYTFKTENRFRLDAAFNKRDGCDDIIIIKNHCVTDSWASNILFFDGYEWITPDTPLLEGIQREYLLSKNLIRLRRVMVTDLHLFQKIKLINAMIDFERAPIIDIPSGLNFGE